MNEAKRIAKLEEKLDRVAAHVARIAGEVQ